MTLQEQYDDEELQLIHDICCYGRYYSREDFDVRDLLSERQYDEEGNKLYSDGLKVYMILRKLGYPGDQIGTAYMAELIEEVMHNLPKYGGTRKEIPVYKSIMEKLEDPFSNYYHFVAREWLEVGIRSYHNDLKEAVNNIDESKVDKELAMKINGSKPIDLNYGLQAFQIAAYLSGFYFFEDNVSEYKPAKVKLLSSKDLYD